MEVSPTTCLLRPYARMCHGVVYSTHFAPRMIHITHSRLLLLLLTRYKNHIAIAPIAP
jgi:hypothetical protein